jgi:hypothetical protein
MASPARARDIFVKELGKIRDEARFRLPMGTS